MYVFEEQISEWKHGWRVHLYVQYMLHVQYNHSFPARSAWKGLSSLNEKTDKTVLLFVWPAGLALYICVHSLSGFLPFWSDIILSLGEVLTG